MEQLPLISVSVAVYKVEQYLERCIESIVNQTYKNLEIILVDDGSPDNCPAICDEWAKKDSRIKVVHQQNGGLGVARNTGIEASTGDYIAFVDGDDYCFADMYSLLYKSISSSGADIAICKYYESADEVDAVPLKNSADTTVSSVEALKHICLGEFEYCVMWNKLYKKSVIGSQRVKPLVCSQDMPFNYFVFKSAENVAICEEQLYFYRNRPNATTKSKFKIGAFDAIKAREIILNNETTDSAHSELISYAVRGFVNSNFVVLTGVIKNNMFTERIPELRSSILKYQKDIFSSGEYRSIDKIKTLILKISPSLFVKLTKR